MIIYKATNTVSGLIYVGMTKIGLHDRVLRHKARAKNGACQIFHDAINEYGFHVFTWEVIDSADTYEDLRKLERVWIKKLDSTNPLVGYNSSGNRTSVKGEDVPQAKLTNNQVIEIKRMLNAGMRNVDVAKEMNITTAVVASIKCGAIWKSIGEPIKQEVIERRLTDEDIIKIKQLLNEGRSQAEIAELTGFSCATVSLINTGKRGADLGEPIKNPVVRGNKLTSEQVIEIKTLIADGLKTREVAEETGVRAKLITEIKAGRRYKDV